jgi:hypothetical protein
MLQSMPNVADLAYARTVGEHIELPQANFLEKIAKLEENKLNKSDEYVQILKISGDNSRIMYELAVFVLIFHGNSQEIKQDESSANEKTSVVDK